MKNEEEIRKELLEFVKYLNSLKSTDTPTDVENIVVYDFNHGKGAIKKTLKQYLKEQLHEHTKNIPK